MKAELYLIIIIKINPQIDILLSNFIEVCISYICITLRRRKFKIFSLKDDFRRGQILSGDRFTLEFC